MLSALATSAVPGFQVVSAQNMATAELDSALVHDVQGVPFVISLPRTAAAEKIQQERIAAARALRWLTLEAALSSPSGNRGVGRGWDDLECV